MEVFDLGLDEIKIIRNKINEKNFLWSAGSTSVSKLPADARRKRLGLVVPDEENKRIQEMLIEEDARMAEQGKIFAFPASWDWRSVSGKDWTTPIRDQGDCGSCVAFATIGMIESGLEIFRRDPGLNPDLSEADLFFRGCGSCCARGWNFVPALNYALASGIPDEACFPYDSDQSRSCPDRDKRIIRILGWRTLSSASQAKEWISRKGPVMSGLHVYDDLFYYQGGIYRNAYGGYIGDHAVCVVGYDDIGGYWICKNSWGTGWGERGWFKIAYGECGLGSRFAFYASQFTADDDLIMPKEGRVIARLKERNTVLNDEIWLANPEERVIFKADDSEIGKSFEIGTFKAGSRLTLALHTSDGHIYYTDQSMNEDACDHVNRVRTGSYKWELRWEDLFGLAEMDYNDVVMELEIFSPWTDDLVMPKDGRVLVTFKSKSTQLVNEFLLSSPQETTIFKAEDANRGKTFDLGLFDSGTKLTFALKTSEGHTFYTDRAKNPDALSHVKKLPIGYNKWELRWEDIYGLKEKDYNDLIVEVVVMPTSNEDVVLLKDSRVTARLVSKSTPLSNQFWLYRPKEMEIFEATQENIGRRFDLGEYPAGTRLVFALKTGEGNTFYTDSSLNPDARGHVIKLPLGSYKCQLRWEDLCDLADRDYNDLVVEIVAFPKV